MKKIFLASLLCNFCIYLSAQCVKPAPLTAQQTQAVTGTWKLQYTYNDKQYDTEIKIRTVKNNEVVCEIANPPITGKETAGEYFFCPSGEFHLKKYVGDIAYVFQGVPENGQIKGTLSVYDKDNKRSQGGDFLMSKIN
ncbi:MAG: hypothetical protein ACTHMV_07315 [Chitinophagaceae bacterium]